MTNPLSSTGISIFSLKNQQTLLYQKIQIYVTFWYIFSNSFDFSGVFKDFLLNSVTILMLSAKLATPGLLKINIFQNKGYDVLFLEHDLINKILTSDSNYIEMWSFDQSLVTAAFL